VVEKNGGHLHSALSNSFLSSISKEAQLIYKAAAHVDGTDNLANGICRLIISFLPMNRRYLGTQLTNEEIDASIEDDTSEDELSEEEDDDDDIDSDDYWFRIGVTIAAQCYLTNEGDEV
jgi:hypothetical protein